MENPFLEGHRRAARPPATILVIFGATGDLTRRKLLPALYDLAADDYLPSDFIVVGAARTRLTDDEFRKKILEGVQRHARREVREEVWQSFASKVYYQPVDAGLQEDFTKLSQRMESLTGGRISAFNYLYYCATASDTFAPIAANLRRAGLICPEPLPEKRTPLIIEKPFGSDLKSAQRLNIMLRNELSESHIYRIDHYLGKDTVQNILALRFANGIFEPLWNRSHINSIQITVAESVGLERRAPYFDQTGMLRDVVQNHLLQMLALICSEPPVSLKDPDSMRDEKVKVLRSLKRPAEADVVSEVVRGQYGSGYILGRPVRGYREEENVPPDSTTETYAAMRLEVDNWRWAGVPIFVRAGKRLPKRITEIAIFFKEAPGFLFPDGARSNVLAIQVQPDEGISLRVGAKAPGMHMHVRDVKMDFSYAPWFGKKPPEAYERLLLDAMNGDATLFARSDEIEESWSFLEPVLDAWKAEKSMPAEYPAGSWGPHEAVQLLKRSGHRWRTL